MAAGVPGSAAALLSWTEAPRPTPKYEAGSVPTAGVLAFYADTLPNAPCCFLSRPPARAGRADDG